MTDPSQAIHPAPQEFSPDEIASDPILRFFHYSHLPDVLKARSKVTDEMRMDWLAKHAVNVRVPLVYGSRDLFWARYTPREESTHAD